MKEITLASEKKTDLKPILKPTELPKTGLKGVFGGTKTINGKRGPFTIHKIGDRALYDATDLGKKLALVSEGTTVQIKFKGKVQLKNGRSFNQFEVLVDEDEE